MFKRILVPLDGSAFAEWALCSALSVARRSGGDLVLVSVSDPDADEGRGEEGAEGWRARYLDAIAEDVVERLGRPVSRCRLRGRPATAILDHVRNTDTDLIVLTSHGRGPLSRAWMGSTADTLIRAARVPVMVLRPHEGEEPDLGVATPIAHVVVPLDGSTRAETVLRPAVGMAGLHRARLTLLRVVELPRAAGSSYLPHAVQHNEEVVAKRVRAAEEYLGALVQQLTDEGHRVEVAVRRDRTPAAGILRFVVDEDPDLVAMATHGRSGVPHLVLGSVADKIVRAGTVPVLLYRPHF